MPRAEDFPDLVSELTEVPARTNPLGVKGAGEAGAPPAVVGAILDALRPLGIDHIDMPANAEPHLAGAQRARDDQSCCGVTRASPFNYPQFLPRPPRPIQYPSGRPGAGIQLARCSA
jgi:hypothetical protein